MQIIKKNFKVKQNKLTPALASLGRLLCREARRGESSPDHWLGERLYFADARHINVARFKAASVALASLQNS